MGISIADLPLAYQEQAVRKYKASLQKEYGSGDRKNKYSNQHATRSGIKFDSKKEANRYDELMLMLQSGDIYDLRLQVDFTLQEAYTTPAGERVRAIRYRADFTYWEISTGAESPEFIIEDVKSKGTVTQPYLMKKKMLKARLGLSITEI